MISARASRWLVAIAVGGATFALAAVLLDPTAPCDSDEGHHVVSALRFSRALSTHDFADFARHTLKGGRYPFLLGWAGAGIFSVFGESLLAIRLMTAALLGASAMAVIALFFVLRPRAHALWGLPVGAAVALAPECLANGTIAMLEVPGLFLVTAGALAYHRHLAGGGRGWALAAGLAVAAAFFVKYPYGAYLLLPLGSAELVRVWPKVPRLFRPPSLLVWGPATLALAVWLAIPQSRASVLTLLGDAPDAVIREAKPDPIRIPVVQPGVLAFYFGTLFRAVTPGIVAGALLSLGAVVAILRGNPFTRLVLAGTILWTILTLSLSYRTFGVDRFLVPVAGLFVALGACGLGEVWARACRSFPLVRCYALLGGVLLFLAAAAETAWRLPRTLDFARIAVETGPEEKEALRWIVNAVETPANLLVVGNWDQLSEDAIKVEFLLARPKARFTDLDVKAIRRDKIHDGTRRLERWFADEAAQRPPGEVPRPTFVLFALPVRGMFGGDVDPDGMEGNIAAARARVAQTGWTRFRQASSPMVAFVLHRRLPGR